MWNRYFPTGVAWQKRPLKNHNNWPVTQTLFSAWRRAHNGAAEHSARARPDPSGAENQEETISRHPTQFASPHECDRELIKKPFYKHV